ncbi:hypothetical protein A33M_1292 [Rhodovulum sp. PH10]|nr:hypothetical protein [Rhodovulum sp. PH10]EJW09451.1 hypothetical protein A33M_1292 [Rhodovulum sp. PH10]
MLNYIVDEENLLSEKCRRDLRSTDDAAYFAFLNVIDVKETSQDHNIR